MDDLVFMEKLPAPQEYNELRNNVGWGAMPLDVVEQSLGRTLFGISVYRENEIIGSGRIVGDGGLCFYIQDVMVKDSFQKRGIGKKIVSELMRYLERNASRNSFVGLMAAKGREPFYAKFGFMQRPNDVVGSGMTLLWGREGEMSES